MGVHFLRKAQVVAGKTDEASAFAADISTHWNETYGTNVTWGFEIGGAVGTIYWMTDYDSLAAFEEVMQASMTNAETNKMLDDSVGLFVGRPTDTIIYTM